MKIYTYNRLMMLSFVLFVAFGCADDQERDLKKAEKRYNFKKAATEDDELFPTYFLAKNGAITKELIDAERAVKVRLNEMAPISLPTKHARLTSAQKDGVVQTYKRFLQSHDEDSLLIRHFRNKYAKVILMDYDVMKSDDYALISFLTKELIDSKCGRFALIFEGISKVKSHVADNQYNSLVTEFENQIAQSLNLHKQAKAAMPGLIQKMKDKPETVQGGLKADFAVELNEMDDLSPRISTLEKYLQNVRSL
ncbi:hypothetical protein [Dyadobacter chenhuakuii]|uniref:Lipoprotein n=1 Tax=Dyadobacter chenhuakuii TaxID=2909339 RepID=A0ABY4XJU1_9BACT|nr:hypothetical protein [Dyadobacter chenhuakuii]MCF2493517.1 hypothetical protein [Dyadobacter chenhuakuii]USJ30657.1 hypothetical protein NFI80_22705 [Dyadobacter chenhuakuii]